MLGSGEAGEGGREKGRNTGKGGEGRGREGKFLLIVNQTNELASLLINTRFELRLPILILSLLPTNYPPLSTWTQNCVSLEFELTLLMQEIMLLLRKRCLDLVVLSALYFCDIFVDNGRWQKQKLTKCKLETTGEATTWKIKRENHEDKERSHAMHVSRHATKKRDILSHIDRRCM